MQTPQLANEARASRLHLIKDRILFEDGIYHITQRAPGREVLFLEYSDYLYFLHILKESAAKFRLNVFSFVLMPNHIHILLQIKENNLAKAMKYAFQRYALYFNKKYERKGHVFCGVYRAALVTSEPYLLAASLYIHLNPYKAGLCLDVRDYQWSSVSLYIKGNGRSFINSKFILELLDRDIDRSRDIYKDFLMKSSRVKHENILEEPKALTHFKDRVAGIFSRNIAKLNGAQSHALDLSELEKKIEFFRKNIMHNKKKLRDPRDIAAVRYIIEQLKSRGYKVNDIAQRLNMDRTTVYRISHGVNSRKSAT
ncbi:transposase [Candidatus Omnitrophota bacterium]